MTKIKPINETPITHEESLRRRKSIQRVKLIITVVSGILLFSFGWLNFKDFPYATLFNDDVSTMLFKIALAIYYFSWVYGTSIDLKDEEYTLLIAPNKGKVNNMAIGIIVTFGILFAILCYAKDLRLFSVSMFLFFLADRIANVYFVKFIKTSLEKSREIYLSKKNYKGALSIKAIEEFLTGSYINLRFFLGMILILIMVAFSFELIPLELIEKYQIPESKVVVNLLVFIFVLFIEIWVWYKRLKRTFYIKLLEEIYEDYLQVENQE